jgi:hypothetical protein
MSALGAATGMSAASMVFTLAGAEQQKEGLLISGNAARMSGRAKRVEAEFEAKQLEQNAGQTIAASQRDAMEVQRQVDLVESRARAVAAASGGSLSDPSIIDNVTRISNMGAYQKAVALYQGEDKARSMRLAAATKRYEGRMAEELGEQTGSAYEKSANAAELAGWAGAASQGASMFAAYK